MQMCYAVKNKNTDVRSQSRSGGFFTAVTDAVLDQGGVVYGCVLTDPYTAEHVRATTASDRDKMRCSKYIPSRINQCYRMCGEDLRQGKTVVFSGTPCQIDALNNYLQIKKVDVSNLITLDVLCFSVASPKVWRRYLDWVSDGKTIDRVQFRDKQKFGWASHRETITIEDNDISSNTFASLFSHLYIAPLSCCNCYFKNTKRVSDITMGDYWGIDQIDPDFFDQSGVSLVLVNTDKGMNAFRQCADCLEIREHALIDSLQPALVKNDPIPSRRKKIFRDLDRISFSKLVKKYRVVPELLCYRMLESFTRGK